jgi:hypothetical protein
MVCCESLQLFALFPSESCWKIYFWYHGRLSNENEPENKTKRNAYRPTFK